MEKFAQNATMAESFLLMIPLSYLMWCTVHNWTSEWWIQGRGPGGLDPLLFLDQTEAQRAEKTFFGDPPPLSKVLDDCPPLSQGLDAALPAFLICTKSCYLYLTYCNQ